MKQLTLNSFVESRNFRHWIKESPSIVQLLLNCTTVLCAVRVCQSGGTSSQPQLYFRVCFAFVGCGEQFWWIELTLPLRQRFVEFERMRRLFAASYQEVHSSKLHGWFGKAVPFHQDVSVDSSSFDRIGADEGQRYLRVLQTSNCKGRATYSAYCPTPWSDWRVNGP